MPRATDNRKPVGTEFCDGCGTTARFYQVQKGNRTGYLYRRCECGCDQKTGAGIQVKWLERMQRTPEPMIPHPLEAVREQVQEPEATPDEPEQTTEPEAPEPQQQQGVNRKTESKKNGLIGLALLLGSVAVAVMT